jgi:hypothetical protein
MKNQIAIELDGKVYLCKFGLEFLGVLLDSLDMSVSEIGAKFDKNPFKWAPILMHKCLEFSNEDLGFTKSELVEMFDKDYKNKEQLKQFITSFVKSLNPNLPEIDSEEIEAKKK